MSKQKPATNNQHKQDTPVVSTQWAGPLPPPSVLSGFNDVVENGAERVFRMAEKEQEHRVSYERAELEATRRDFRRGQVIGGVLAFSCVAASLLFGLPGGASICQHRFGWHPDHGALGKIL